ncbi:MAG: hypothetical protein AAGF76_11115 [Pseudomonadota bacterium]
MTMNFGRIWGARRDRGRPLPPGIERPLYVVGPVRGEAVLLERMVSRVLTEMARRGAGRRRITTGRREPAADLVLIGNHLGGGTDGVAVLDLIREIASEPRLRTTALLGPQEYRVGRFLGGQCDGRRWLRGGGIAFLAACGIAPGRGLDQGVLRAALIEALGPRRAMLDAMAPSARFGNVLVSFSGGDPLLPPAQQSAEVLVLGPEVGRYGRRADGLWSVHAGTLAGDDAVPGAEETPDASSSLGPSIGICTGAHFAHRLAALRIEPSGEQAILTVENSAEDPMLGKLANLTSAVA